MIDSQGWARSVLMGRVVSYHYWRQGKGGVLSNHTFSAGTRPSISECTTLTYGHTMFTNTVAQTGHEWAGTNCVLLNIGFSRIRNDSASIYEILTRTNS